MERTHQYEFESKVRYSEIDHRGTMTLPALINYFQDCSTFQSEEIGYGMEVLKKEKKGVGTCILASDRRKISQIMRKDYGRNICGRL